MTEAQVSAAEQARVQVLKDRIRAGVPSDGGSYDAVAALSELRDADRARSERLAGEILDEVIEGHPQGR